MPSDVEIQHNALWAKAVARLAEHPALPDLAALGWRFMANAEEREQLRAGLHRRYGPDPVMPVFRRDDGDDVLALIMARGTISRSTPPQRAVQIHDYAEPGWQRTGAWSDVADWIAERLSPPTTPSRKIAASLDEVIAWMQETFAQHDAVHISTDDVMNWSIDLGLTPCDLLDRLAAHLVVGFHQGALDYAYCDVVANALFKSMIEFDGTDSFSWNTYLAFDEGEHSHGGKSADPVEEFTRPAVADLFAQLQAQDLAKA